MVHESVLGQSVDWVDFTFSAVTGLDPNQAIFVVVKHAGLGGTYVAILQREYNISDEPGYAVYKTENAGSTWTLLDGELRFFVYGVAHQ